MNSSPRLSRRIGVVVAFTALPLILAGCAGAGSEAAAQECGGASAGITVTDRGEIVYTQDDDPGRDAYVCLLGEFFSDRADQYEVANWIDGGTSGPETATISGVDVVVSNTAANGFWMSLHRP